MRNTAKTLTEIKTPSLINKKNAHDQQNEDRKKKERETIERKIKIAFVKRSRTIVKGIENDFCEWMKDYRQRNLDRHCQWMRDYRRRKKTLLQLKLNKRKRHLHFHYFLRVTR